MLKLKNYICMYTYLWFHNVILTRSKKKIFQAIFFKKYEQDQY